MRGSRTVVFLQTWPLRYAFCAVVNGQNWIKRPKRNSFFDKWHDPYLPRICTPPASSDNCFSPSHPPTHNITETSQNAFDLARSFALCASRSWSRLTGAHRSPIEARNISPALSTTTDTFPNEYT